MFTLYEVNSPSTLKAQWPLNENSDTLIDIVNGESTVLESYEEGNY